MKILFLFLLFSSSLLAQELSTIAEKSDWVNTGRADEAAKLCRNFQKKYPQRVQCKIYGETPEGRSLHYLLVQDKKNTPVVWVQAGIHAGEIDGKDAVFWLLKDILENKVSPDPLKGLTLAFIPIVNLDGHERFGEWNRPNQVGPTEMGWRTTAQNYNMNRDFAKADSPEMQDLLKLWIKLDPIISLDLHVTNGAQFQPEIGLIVTPTSHHGNTPLHLAGKEFENALMLKMKERGHMAMPFYPSFEEEDIPSTGFSRYVSTPRFSQGYWYNQNRLGMLVETHSWKDYKTRVRAHRSTVLSTLEIAQKNAASWIAAAKELDKTDLSSERVDLEYKHTVSFSIIDFPGYKYTMEKSDVSGTSFIRYYPNKPQIWKVPFYEELTPSLTITAPKMGYFIPPTQTSWLIPKLKLHGIEFQKWRKPAPLELETFRATRTEFSKTPFEGHQTLTVQGSWVKELRPLTSGTIFVPIKQKRARLLMQLLEPRARDSFLYWGFMNAAFEMKEYMENYVAEEVAKEMLTDKKIRKEFEAKLKDKEFASDPSKRLEFFYRIHPSWDERFNLYPIYRQ